MKKLLLPILLLILIGCSEPEPLNYGLLEERDGVHYRKDTNEIYSGPVFNIEGKSEGTLKKGKFHGPVKIYHDNGQLEEEKTYKNSIKNGPYKTYYENGQLQQEGTFKDGQLDGPVKIYHDNGQLQQEGTFKDGQLDGPYKKYSYHDNGQLALEETYKDDMYDGPFKSYYENGQLREEGTYKDDKADGPYKVYYDNGQLEEEITFKDGQRDGPSKVYYDNGQLYKEETYKDDYKDGPSKVYYDNGQLERQGTYKDGKPYGPSKVYSINGEPIEQVRFVLHFDLLHLINNLASSKDKKFDIFLDDLNNQYSNNNSFALAGISDVYTTAANANNNGLEGLYIFKTPPPSTTPNAFGELEEEQGSPWDWWDNTAYGIQAEAINGVQGVTSPAYFEANALLGNPDMSSAKGNAYLDTIQGYLNPRMYLTLGLGTTLTINELIDKTTEIYQ